MKVDLNLFVVFEAIYCEGNITKAASALNLSQPAVSHSLNFAIILMMLYLFVKVMKCAQRL